MTAALVIAGRRWWCEAGDLWPITLQAWGPHNSQHFLDPYTFSHILHGVILYFVFHIGGLRKFPAWQLLGVMFLEAVWEVFENSPYVINRYRTETAAVGYTGDSIFNSIADFLACYAGWLFSRRFGWKWAIVAILVMEIGCLLWIRDNLTLNVIMILHPIKAIQNWQSGG